MDRRELLAGLGAAGLGGGAAPPRGVVEGETTWSESAMVLCFDPEVRNGVSFRISRFPDRGRTWLWCHLLIDGAVYAYTDQALPCEPRHVTPDLATATYDTPGLHARISRLGPSDDLRAISFSFAVKGHKGSHGIDGPGRIPMMAEGVFHPGPLRRGSRSGRFERGGRLDAVIGVGGVRRSLVGLAKAHEQTQTGPRFASPFTYAMLWGETASLIGRTGPTGDFGDFLAGEEDRPLKTFLVERWGPQRRFGAVFEDGASLMGTAQAVANFDVPVFNELWRGHIVRAELDGHRMVGMINDWRPDARAYNMP